MQVLDYKKFLDCAQKAMVSETLDSYNEEVFGSFFHLLGKDQTAEDIDAFVKLMRITASDADLNLPEGTFEIFRTYFKDSIPDEDVKKFIYLLKEVFSEAVPVVEPQLIAFVEAYAKDIEEEVLEPSEEPISLDEEKDYEISGEIQSNLTISNAKSATITDLKVTNGARTDIKAAEVEIKNSSWEGEFPKATANAITKFNEVEVVNFDGLTFDTSGTSYNAIEIGLSGVKLPKEVNIKNCQFKGVLTNNAISIFGVQDNAVINIENCTFETISNLLRYSNIGNAKGVVINVVNCSVQVWSNNPNYDYGGYFCLQDYTSGDAQGSQAAETKIFNPNNLTINVINCSGPNGKITTPEDLATVCASKTIDQLVYIFAQGAYTETGGIAPYDAETYPTINIK